VGTVSAKDRDLSPNNVFAYTFQQDNKTAVDTSFEIDPRNGTISTRKILNRELLGSYYLVIVASEIVSDEGVKRDQQLASFSASSSTANVAIFVLDDNDNSPVFTFPTLDNNTVQISNRVPLGFIVASLVASDGDAESNAGITYRFVLDNSPLENGGQGGGGSVEDGGGDAFSIDPVLGTVLTKQLLNQFDYKLFRLTVAASDQGMSGFSRYYTLTQS